MSSYPGDERYAREAAAARANAAIHDEEQTYTKNGVPLGPGDPDTASAYTSTSGAKSSEKMPPYFLVPLAPVLDRIAARFGYGADKYGQDNWRKGLTDREWLIDRANHAMKHLIKVLDKLRRGVPTNEGDDDLAGVAWAMTVIAESERVAKDSDGAILTAHAALDKAISTLKTSLFEPEPQPAAGDRCVACGVTFQEHLEGKAPASVFPHFFVSGRTSIAPVVAPVVGDTPDIEVSPSAVCWVCSLIYEQHSDRTSHDSRPGHIRNVDGTRTFHYFELAAPGPHKSYGDSCVECNMPYRDHLPLDANSPHWRGRPDDKGRLHHWFRRAEPTTLKVTRTGAK